MVARTNLIMKNNIMRGRVGGWLMGLAGVLALGISANANEPIKHTKDTLATVKEKLAKGKAVLVDVREKIEWEDGHLKAAVLVPLSELREGRNNDEFAKELAKKLPGNKIIYCHCRSGGRVLAAAPILRALKYDVRPLKAGYRTLVESGFKKAK